MYLIL